MTEMIVAWFRSFGLNPERSGITAPGFGDKMAGFQRRYSRLQKLGFSQVSYLELDVQIPDASLVLNEWLISGCWSVDDAFCFISCRNSLARLGDPSFESIAVELADILDPDYGIGYERTWDKGPFWFSVGVGCSMPDSPVDHERGPNDSYWSEGMEHRVYRHGFLRDVYPWNFLTRYQWDRRVEGGTLRDWIQADAARGTLTPVTDHMIRWSLTPEQIARVRPILIEKGFIFELGPNTTPRGHEAFEDA